MAISTKVELLGIFEDGPQREFVTAVVENVGKAHGHQIVIEPRLTAGCRLDYLEEHLHLAPNFVGVLLGVDGAGRRRAQKISKLEKQCPVQCRKLWAVAEPSVEEWMMADAEALPAALRELFGAGSVSNAPRPGRTQAERTAKQRLHEWVEGLLGEPAIQGGVEYAADVGRKLSPAHVGSAE